MPVTPTKQSSRLKTACTMRGRSAAMRPPATAIAAKSQKRITSAPIGSLAREGDDLVRDLLPLAEDARVLAVGVVDVHLVARVADEVELRAHVDALRRA